MNNLVRSSGRPVARVLILALALGAVPACCLAGPPPVSPPSAPKLAASIEKAARQEVAHSAKASPRASRQAGSTAPSSGSFIKSKKGAITMVLLAAGAGFALYSTSHDRVKSPQVPYGGTWQ